MTATSLVLRTSFHPFGLLKIRLQTAKKSNFSTFQIARSVWRDHGLIRGLYRGFSVSVSTVIFEPVFTVVLEQTRTTLYGDRPSQLTPSQWDMITNALSSGGLVCVINLLPVNYLFQLNDGFESENKSLFQCPSM